MPDVEDKVIIGAPESLRSIGFPDLILVKAGPEHQDSVTADIGDDLAQRIDWSSKFAAALNNNKDSLAALELIRGVDEIPISLARFRVDESIDVVHSAINFNVGLNIVHPDTRNQMYAVNNILIDDSVSLHDLIRQVFACLYSHCAVRLVVKANNFYTAALAAYLVDLMYACGALSKEVCCLAFDRRETIGNEKFTKPIAPAKSSKLSIVATVFRQTDTFAAAQGIIDSYFREQYPNLIVLVDEAAYERFIKDWQRYYSNVIHIGPRLDEKTSVVDSFNSKIKIDLAAIDIKASHKMSGNVINILKFRTANELMSLLGNLRKVPHMSIWEDNIQLSHEFCMRLNQCKDFWLNHIPKGIAGHKFPETILSYYKETVAEDMFYIYNSVYNGFADEAEQLRKTLTAFQKKDGRLRTTLILQSYISIVNTCKSLKSGSTVGESIARLKRFHNGCRPHITSPDCGGSRVKTILRPVGLAIFLVRDETSVKNKALLLEFVFKNLLLGNAVLLACPVNLLGAKFNFINDHVIPFKMVHDEVPDISRLSLDSSVVMDNAETSINKKQCPNNTYAIEILPEMNCESFETITMALGCCRKSIWQSDVEQADYWSSE